MELNEALSQIAEIRLQLARGQIFRGYRAATTAFSGIVALLSGLLATFAIPATSPTAFISLWVASAILCVAVVAIEMIIRTRRSFSDVQRSLTLLAVEQFVPSIAAGALVTWVFWDFLPAQFSLLPGIWMILFSLGAFASCRLLPRQVFFVAAFYLLAGIFTLILTRNANEQILSLYMAAVFGTGQLALAAILYLKLERNHAR